MGFWIVKIWETDFEFVMGFGIAERAIPGYMPIFPASLLSIWGRRVTFVIDFHITRMEMKNFICDGIADFP